MRLEFTFVVPGACVSQSAVLSPSEPLPRAQLGRYRPCKIYIDMVGSESQLRVTNGSVSYLLRGSAVPQTRDSFASAPKMPAMCQEETHAAQQNAALDHLVSATTAILAAVSARGALRP